MNHGIDNGDVTIRPVLSDQLVFERFHALLEEMEDMLVGVEPMSPEEIAHTARFPGKADGFIAEVTRCCAALDIKQLGEGITLDEARRELARGRALRQVLERYDHVRARLHGWRLQSESRGWKGTLTFYAMLKRVARGDEGLRGALESVGRLFEARGSGGGGKRWRMPPVGREVARA